MKDLKRFLRLMWGLFLAGVGMYFTIQANIGLAPWDAFGMGLAMKTGMIYGDAVLWIGVVVIGLDLALHEKIGIGTLLNATIIGKFVDLFEWLNLVPEMQSFAAGVGMMLLGQLIVCFACYYYIGAEWGAGPRDSLMVSLNRKIPKLPIGAARFTVELIVLMIGWALGAPVGFGTAMYMFGISLLMQTVFHILHFDPKALHHEGLLEMFQRIVLHRAPADPA